MTAARDVDFRVNPSGCSTWNGAAPGFGLEESLRSSVVLFLVVLCLSQSTRPAGAQNNRIPLTVEGINAHGPLIGTPPRDLAWSPNGKHLTYMDGGELIDLDPGTGRPHVLVSRAKLAAFDQSGGTEHERDRRERYQIASYQWAPDSRHLLFDASGRLWLYDLANGTGVQVGFADAGPGDDPKFSPNGEAISFIRGNGLSVVRPLNIANASPISVASSPATTQATNGEVDWVYEEELDVRSNYFWSPDSRNLAFLQMNETSVPEYPLTDWIPTHAVVELQRYPQAGDSNPDVRVGVVSSSGGKVYWIRLPKDAEHEYIPRFGWVDKHTVWIETLSRTHRQRELYFTEPSTGQSRQVLEIKDDKFLDENYDVYVGDGVIVLTDWKDGHNHIYLYSYDGSNPMSGSSPEPKQLTSGDFEVGEIAIVNAALKLVFYSSNEGNPLEQQLFEVSFDGQRKPLTTASGYHEGRFSRSGPGFVDTYSTRMDPPRLSLCAAGSECREFWSTRSLEPYGLRAPEQMEVKAHDGATLYATLLLPEGATEAASVPLIVNPYGGPGPQEVANKWGGDRSGDNLLFDELLAEHGFAVLHADNRGTGRRGRTFAQAAYHNFGPVQLEDQLTVLDAALAKYPQLDKERLGWWGWSWGGTFTLYAMSHSNRFKAGVSVAPVTDWRDYDSIYTERYMSLPSEFPEGYKDFSVVNSAAKMKGHLLLVHGTGDDNVHIENSVQFIQKLIEAGIPYDLRIYPRKTHSISGPDARTHLFNGILQHFEDYLKPRTGQER